MSYSKPVGLVRLLLPTEENLTFPSKVANHARGRAFYRFCWWTPETLVTSLR